MFPGLLRGSSDYMELLVYMELLMPDRNDPAFFIIFGHI